jgi:hypothetical protein
MTRSYRLEVSDDGMRATLSSPSGERWAILRPFAALDTTDGPDETLAVEPPRVDGDTIVVERRSTRWEQAAVTLVCTHETVEVRTSVRGRGVLTDVHLLGGRLLIPGEPAGFLPSGSRFEKLFTPNPGDPPRPLRSAGEPAVIGVSGDSEPGRVHGFFTPAPLFLCLDSLGLWLAAPVEELRFPQLVYVPGDAAFSLRLDYEGHTEVDGVFEAPVVVLRPGIADPYGGIRDYRSDLVARGCAPAPHERDRPAWWREPIFCGWGAQCRLAALDARPAAAYATQESYDAFLAHLERNGLVPGTIVIDDKWQVAYGTNEPDEDKWPDLRGWIAERHANGQRVLLWWKAWDPEGLPPEHCIRNPDGAPVAFDPTNPDARRALAAMVARMLGPDRIDADGLKVDFTARTPSGTALTAHGDGWGIALLHELLRVVHDSAKEAKPDALLITQTPHPSFVDVTDMLRLNDMPQFGIVKEMSHRAAVARAACPELLIDTDDWSVPDLAEWREYLEAKPLLGVPSLYYAESLDRSGEHFEQQDYEALRRVWERARRS